LGHPELPTHRRDIRAIGEHPVGLTELANDLLRGVTLPTVRHDLTSLPARNHGATGRLSEPPDLGNGVSPEANQAVEEAIADGKRKMLVTMATGTGKTLTTVNQAYRLMKSGVA